MLPDTESSENISGTLLQNGKADLIQHIHTAITMYPFKNPKTPPKILDVPLKSEERKSLKIYFEKNLTTEENIADIQSMKQDLSMLTTPGFKISDIFWGIAAGVLLSIIWVKTVGVIF